MIMTNWKRKHVDDLAHAVKRYTSQDDAAAVHRESLGELYTRAKHLATCAHNCTDANIGEVVVALCGICKAIEGYRCEGRKAWSQHCALVADACR